MEFAEVPEYMAIGRAAKMIDRHKDTLKRWAADGTYPYHLYRMGGDGRLHVKVADFKEFIAKSVQRRPNEGPDEVPVINKMYSGPVVRSVYADLRDVCLNSSSPAMRALAEQPLQRI